MRGRGWSLLLAAALLLGAATRVEAQGQRISQLAITGFPRTVTGTTPDDFEAGFISFGFSTITVDLTRNVGAGGFSPRVTTVEVRCGTPCPASAGQVQWRRADLGTWTSLSGTFTAIETRVATFGGANDPWSRNIEWRYVLDWATTPPVTALQIAVDFQLVVTAP